MAWSRNRPTVWDGRLRAGEGPQRGTEDGYGERRPPARGSGGFRVPSSEAPVSRFDPNLGLHPRQRIDAGKMVVSTPGGFPPGTFSTGFETRPATRGSPGRGLGDHPPSCGDFQQFVPRTYRGSDLQYSFWGSATSAFDPRGAELLPQLITDREEKCRSRWRLMPRSAGLHFLRPCAYFDHGVDRFVLQDPHHPERVQQHRLGSARSKGRQQEEVNS